MARAIRKVGKKYAVHLPKAVAKAAGLKEGDKVEFKASGGEVPLRVLHDPLELALTGSKFASMDPSESGEISADEQARYGQGPP